MTRQALFKYFVFITLFLLSGYTLICGYFWLRQERHIFFPQREIEKTPADLSMVFEDLYLSVNGPGQKAERLHGWWIPAEETSDKTLLYLHGSALNIGANVTHARRFHRLGFSILLISYRGYGLSDGKFPNEKQVYTDAETAWRYLGETRQIEPGQIFIYGHSIGGAVAIELAVRHPEAAGLITEATITSIVEVARQDKKYSLFPLSLIVHQRFDSLKKVVDLRVPVLFRHGDQDQYIPFEMSRRLYAHSPGKKVLKVIRGGGHRNSAKVGGDVYLNAVTDFVADVQRSQQ